MNIVAVMMARGIGSTLERKNAYPLLGKPMLQWALEEAKKAKFIDEIFVFTEDKELQRITRECGCMTIPRTKDQVFYHGGTSNPNDWGPKNVVNIENYLDGKIDIQLDINCNYCLMTGRILEEMYGKLMEDMTACDIFPVSKFHGDLFQPYRGMLFPVWHCQNLPKQQYPPLVLRGSGISITHKKRQREHVELRTIYHTVPMKYLLDVHDEEDVELAEFYLRQRPKPQWEPRLHELDSQAMRETKWMP